MLVVVVRVSRLILTMSVAAMPSLVFNRFVQRRSERGRRMSSNELIVTEKACL